MAFTPENAAIRMTPEMEKALATANADEIKELMTQAAVEQGLATRDHYSPDVLLPTELAGAAPKNFARTVTIDGHKHIVESETELGLEKAVGDLYRAAMAQPAATAEPTVQPRNEREQFVSAEDAGAKVALELAFKRGDIDSTTYLERSGAIDSYLASQGVDMDSLREVSNKRFEQSWEQATEEWKGRHSRDWVGGEQNRDTIGQILVDNNLVDAEDKVAALETAYNYARENGLLVENPELITRQKVSEATSVEEIRQAVGYRNTTGMWGR